MKLEEYRKIFDNLYEEYLRDLSGWSMMNTDLGSRKHRDEYYHNRTLQLCMDFNRKVAEREFLNYKKDI